MKAGFRTLPARFVVVCALWFSFQSSAAVKVTFSAMGDVPYRDDEFALLEKQLAELPGQSEFAVHVGDIKRGFQPCVESRYIRVRDLLAKSPIPLFILPGDNEYNDCSKPAEAWKFWTTHFMRFDDRWPNKSPVSRQSVREENFSFVRKGVLFVGVSILGGSQKDKVAWAARRKDNVEWIRSELAAHPEVSSAVLFSHAFPDKGYLEIMEKAASDFARPILHIQGDGHYWIKDHPYKKAKNILRVQLIAGGGANPLKVDVTDDAAEPFILTKTRTIGPVFPPGID